MSENNPKIYLDYAATTPLDEEVFLAMKTYFLEKFGNASSIHQFGQEAAEAVVEVRHTMAKFLNCEPSEVIFTGGATEGNNSVIKSFGAASKPHIIISSIEHDCVLASSERLEKEGLAEITKLPVDHEGIMEIEELKKAIKENTVLISIMYANNEIGTIQPIAAIGKFLKEINQNRQNKIYFHTDAAQAVNYLDCDVQKLGVDLMTLSAHKIYGPKGVGALFVRHKTPFKRFMDGGEQEFKMRAGTHNTPGIVGLGAAIREIKNYELRIKKISELRDKLIKGVMDKISGTALNGSWEKRLPNNVNFRFEGVEGEAMLVALDMEGIAASTGSACAAKSLSPSHVLLAMGLNHLQAHGSLRFSLGRYSTEKEIDKVLEVLPGIIEKLRAISGNFKSTIPVERGKLPDDFGC